MKLKEAAVSAAVGAAVATVIGYLCALVTLYWIADRML
jgi:hypothetical protein